MKLRQRRLLSTLIAAFLLVFVLGGNIAFADASIISAIEVNQVLGYDISNTDGAVSLMNNFVAGKNTAVFVPLTTEVEVDKVNKTQTLTIKRNGELVTTMTPTGEKSPTSLLEFIPKSLKDVDEWQAGTYEFTVQVGGETKVRTVEFKQTKILNVLAVPVKANYGGDIRVPGDTWKTANNYLADVYPVASRGINWEISPEFDCSDPIFDLTTDNGMANLWKALTSLQMKDENGNPKYSMIIGFVKDRQGADGRTQGYTYGMPATIVTESDQDMLGTVAHEIAHCYGVGDEYSGGALNPAVNAPPFGMVGSDWNDRSKTIKSDKEFAKDNPTKFGDGSIIPEATHPFEYGGRGLLPDMVSYMGSGGLQKYYWTTSAIYDQIYKSLLVPAAATTASAGTGGSGFGILAKTAQVRLIEAKGWVHKDGSVDVDPWYSSDYDEDASTESTGAYSVVSLDASGKVLSSNSFDISFYTQSYTLNKAPFDVMLSYPENTKSFEIRKGDKAIKTVKVSPNAPKVTIDTPKAGTELKGKQTINWTGSDADGDKLTYQVWYSPTSSGNDWQIIGADMTKNSMEVDFDDLPGGDNANIYVFASDGTNTTGVMSDEFKVNFKAPEVFVDEPKTSDKVIKYMSNEEIWFSGSAYDNQDDWLKDEALVWKDSEGTVLGTGADLYYGPNDLSEGTYDITLTATNSKGLSSNKTFEIEVEKSTTQITIDGKPLTVDVAPVTVSGRTLIPLRAIFEALGAQVTWDASTRSITGTKDNTKVSLTVDSADATVNGTAKTLDVPATIVNGRTMVPVRFVSESLGAKVEWDSYSRTVVIKTK